MVKQVLLASTFQGPGPQNRREKIDKPLAKMLGQQKPSIEESSNSGQQREEYFPCICKTFTACSSGASESHCASNVGSSVPAAIPIFMFCMVRKACVLTFALPRPADQP